MDEVSAIYGLIWQNPKLIASALYRVCEKKEKHGPYGFYFLKDGFQKVWDTIVEQEKLNIKYNVDIHNIKQTQNNVELSIWNGSNLETERCDWMVFTPPLQEFLRLVDVSNTVEYNLFGVIDNKCIF